MYLQEIDIPESSVCDDPETDPLELSLPVKKFKEEVSVNYFIFKCF